jgi:hypothetical protein
MYTHAMGKPYSMKFRVAKQGEVSYEAFSFLKM